MWFCSVRVVVALECQAWFRCGDRGGVVADPPVADDHRSVVALRGAFVAVSGVVCLLALGMERMGIRGLSGRRPVPDVGNVRQEYQKEHEDCTPSHPPLLSGEAQASTHVQKPVQNYIAAAVGMQGLTDHL